jgi:hypothetical protein
VWDFWLVRDGRDYHAFYLQAPRSLGDPELRRLNASVGHAASKDLRHWRVLPDALSAGPAGAWDDSAVWTGCVVRERGRWHMFYTGVSVEGDSVVQRLHSRFPDRRPVGSLYSGKLVEGPDGRPYFLAWRNIAPDGTFVGELADPFQVTIDGEGSLSVGRAQTHHLR